MIYFGIVPYIFKYRDAYTRIRRQTPIRNGLHTKIHVDSTFCRLDSPHVFLLIAFYTSHEYTVAMCLYLFIVLALGIQ